MDASPDLTVPASSSVRVNLFKKRSIIDFLSSMSFLIATAEYFCQFLGKMPLASDP